MRAKAVADCVFTKSTTVFASSNSHWLKSHRLSKITKMTVHIHSEREMCGQCAATSAEMVANLASHAPEIAEALKLAGGADAAGTHVTSTHKFRGAAPSADPATASAATPTADAPSGKKQSAKPPGLGRG
jgi:hypothetical protein